MTGTALPQKVQRNHFPFFELPVELQQHVLFSFLAGWKATLEIHEKQQSQTLIAAGANPIKSTTRIWSSNIADMLNFALTCKIFQDFVYATQWDSALFSGELDLVEANGDLKCLLAPTSFYRPKRFRTAVFLKQGPYPKDTVDTYRDARQNYHDKILDWIIQNTRHLSLYADEIVAEPPWSHFTNLKSVNLYLPVEYLLPWHGTRYPCEQSQENACQMVQRECYQLYEDNNRGWKMLTGLDIDIFVQLQTTHMHLLSYEQEDDLGDVEAIKELTIEEVADMVIICKVKNNAKQSMKLIVLSS
ncbi:hypothetical protein H2198_006113 [Neophaeococcomyces mojaviensis]|uniref:Uncharacterized protein n=1 Tax=Neophaeococcomyces mojaviensis TaxID=3383035 RepID=A0ACC3A3S4_9EURO|nr:hypothetical protein H2198_006113 [Knufia sp. JES_112]